MPTVIIRGESSPKLNAICTYNIASGFHGVSGTKATWKVTNGYFNDGNKSTTLSQNVDIMQVQVVWTKAGQQGILSYSYKNGSAEAYTGTFNVIAVSDSSAPPSGSNTGGITRETLVGPKVIYLEDGDVEYMTFRFPNAGESERTFAPQYDKNYFSLARDRYYSSDSHIKFELKPLKPTYGTRTPVSIITQRGDINYGSSRCASGHVEIRSATCTLTPNGVGSDNVTDSKYTQFYFKFLLNGEDYTSKADVSWSVVGGMQVAWYNKGNVVFMADFDGYMTVKVVCKYDGRTYTKECKIWVGPPSPFSLKLNGGSTLSPLTNYTAFANSDGATSYQWNVMGNASIVRDTDSNYIYFETGESSEGFTSIIRIRCTATNKCGSTQAIKEFGLI